MGIVGRAEGWREWGLVGVLGEGSEGGRDEGGVDEGWSLGGVAGVM